MTVRTARPHTSTVDFPDDVQLTPCTTITVSLTHRTRHGVVRHEVRMNLRAWQEYQQLTKAVDWGRECLDYNASDPLCDRCDTCGREQGQHP